MANQPIYAPDPLEEFNQTLMRLAEMNMRRRQFDAQQALADKNYALSKAQEDRLASNQSFNEAQVVGPQKVAQQGLENELTPAASFLMAQYNPATGTFMNGGANNPNFEAPTQAALDYAQMKTGGATQPELRAAAFGADKNGQTGLYSEAQAQKGAKQLQRMRDEYLKGLTTQPGLTKEQKDNSRAQAAQVFALADMGYKSKEMLELMLPNEIQRNYAVMQKTVAELREIQNIEGSDKAATVWLKRIKPAAFGTAGDVIPGAAKLAMSYAEIDHRAAMAKWTAETTKAVEGRITVPDGIKHFSAELAKKVNDLMEVTDPMSGAMGVRPRMTVEQAHAQTVEEFRTSGYFAISPGLEQAVTSAASVQKRLEDAAVPAVGRLIQENRAFYPEMSQGDLRKRLEDEMTRSGWSLDASRRLLGRALRDSAKTPAPRAGGKAPRKPAPGSQLFGGGS